MTEMDDVKDPGRPVDAPGAASASADVAPPPPERVRRLLETLRHLDPVERANVLEVSQAADGDERLL